MLFRSILDIASGKIRNLTNAPGGDYRPSWSPDGKSIAFTSDRGTGFPHAPGRWEHTQIASIYLINADGSGYYLSRTSAPTSRDRSCVRTSWPAPVSAAAAAAPETRLTSRSREMPPMRTRIRRFMTQARKRESNVNRFA